jgi:hypothetical protein
LPALHVLHGLHFSVNREDNVGSIVFVHGTGVRLKSYTHRLQLAREVAGSAGVKDVFVECAWGDPLGIFFKGDSLPDPPSPKKLQEEAEDFAQWNWLFDDPLFELDKLMIRDTSSASKSLPLPGRRPEWDTLWNTIAAYQPSDELRLLLARGGLTEFWSGAWSEIVQVSPIPRAAFEASAHELPEASRALARAVIAQLHVDAVEHGVTGPSRSLRDSLFERLLVDWKQQVYGLGDFFTKMFKRATTSVLRNHRSGFSDAIALPIGDILLYQSRGEEVRRFIRKKIEGAAAPITLVAHSLGGIACVDLLALPNPPAVARLVTAGSQSPLLYEIGALASLKPPQRLPNGFPPWLNLYDRNDFLSYVGHRVWQQVKDFEIESGQPFPDSHSAYFGNELVWREIRSFMGQ